MDRFRRAWPAGLHRGRAVGVVALVGALALALAVGGVAAAKPSSPGKSTVAGKATPKQAAAAASGAKKATLSKKAMTVAARKKAAAAAKKRQAAKVARIIRAAGPPPPVKKQYDGVASFYTAGRRTASGRRYNPGAMTAAHRSLPFGTKVQVLDKRSGRAVTVTINDRGPFKRGRVIDLSRAAARALGMSHRGVTRVRVTVLKRKA